MPRFISDKEMADLEQPASPKFISDDEMSSLEGAPEVSQLESGLRGLAQGGSLGFADEATGLAEALWNKAKGNPEEFGRLYEISRNQSRDAYKQAESANPTTYGAGELTGAVGSAFIPGLNVAKGASLATTAGRAALQGGLMGAGATEESLASLGGLKDVATGAALGGAGGAAGYGLGKAVGAGTDAISDIGIATSKAPFGQVAESTAQQVAKPGLLERALPKAASFFSGVDEDAARRQMLRPAQVAAADADDFAYKTGQKALAETDTLRRKLGSDVGRAGQEFLGELGNTPMPNQLADKIDNFLSQNSKSKMGFSSLSDSEIDALDELSRRLKNGVTTGEDLYKLRGYLDHVEKLAGKYDKDGTGPFIGFLKSVRGEADAIADKAFPQLDEANKAYGQFADDTSLLRGATNESQAEGMINNLYGANKTVKQEAAGRLFSPDTMESARDIAANKAFEGAKRPGGDNYFRRGALGALTFGGSELVTSPDVWKKGLRVTGKISQNLPEVIKTSPQIFGRFAPSLQAAAQRGTQAVAATHFILQQTQPEYQDLIRGIDEQDDEAGSR